MPKADKSGGVVTPVATVALGTHAVPDSCGCCLNLVAIFHAPPMILRLRTTTVGGDGGHRQGQ